MSHHLDSPIARQDIRLDITDLYVFRGETGTVFVINLCHSIFGPIPVPGYHPEGMYEFKVDLNGDAIEDLTYRFTFNERDKNARQTYTLRRLTGADAANPEAAGTVVAQGTTGEVLSTAPGLRVWAGKAGDHSGSSPMYYMPLATHFRMEPPSIFPDGIQVAPRTCLQATPSIPLCWSSRIRSCSPAQATSVESAYGRCQH